MTDLDQRTLVALRQSIEKWEQNAEAKTPDDYLVEPITCALCSVFYFDEDCVGCPVSSATGKQFCERTPYRAAEAMLGVWMATSGNKVCALARDAARAEARSAARKEADFLRSLWPAGAVIDDDGVA